MSYRILLITKTVVCLVFGVFLLAAPPTLPGILGTDLGAGGMFAGREAALQTMAQGEQE